MMRNHSNSDGHISTPKMELSFDEEDENDPENMADPMIVEKLFKVRMLIPKIMSKETILFQGKTNIISHK